MEKVIVIRLAALRNGEHHLFMLNALKFWNAPLSASDNKADTAGAEGAKAAEIAALAGELAALAQAESEEAQAFHRKDLAPLRKEISILDAEQDRLHCALYALVKLLAREVPGSRVTTAAQELLLTFHRHPVETLVSQKQQAAMERVLINHLLPQREALAACSPAAEEWLTRLDTVNARITRLIGEAGTARAALHTPTLREARLNTDTAYRNLLRKINGLNLMTDGAWDEPIRTWNATVKDFGETITRRSAMPKRKEKPPVTQPRPAN